MNHCPHCQADIADALYKEWSGDYWMSLDEFECPVCKNIVSVDVDIEPVFITSKKEVTHD